MNKRHLILTLLPLSSLLFSCGGGSSTSSGTSSTAASSSETTTSTAASSSEAGTSSEEKSSSVKVTKTLSELIPFLNGLNSSNVTAVKKEEGNMTITSGIRYIDYSSDIEDISAVLSLASLTFESADIYEANVCGAGYVTYELEVNGEWKGFTFNSFGTYWYEGNPYTNRNVFVNFKNPSKKTFKLLSHTMEFTYYAYGQEDNILCPKGFDIDEVEFYQEPVMVIPEEVERPIYIGKIEAFGEIYFYSKTLVSFCADYSDVKNYYEVAGDHYFAFMFPEVG